ncbi:hypothetical protein ESZ50_10325 [Weissella muntiaci]|uniref:Uncharacterized protein n=1 Tax=Weissella muntiaci TaxID=2508881 RepID=A0A6C2C401_9LACO|nr:hypothetical protein [Weissella muntiaci]TYC48015.1 hypothetical protein ESZ50_10325 [Weissella muntiaci]
MAFSEVEMLEVISEIMLVDPASETPKIKEDLKDVNQHQLTNLIIGLANSYHDNEIDVDLDKYKQTVLAIKDIKSDSDFDTLMDSFFAAYPE